MSRGGASVIPCDQCLKLSLHDRRASHPHDCRVGEHCADRQLDWNISLHYMQGDSRKIEKNLEPITSAMRVSGQMKRLACEAVACGDVVRVRRISLSRSPQRDLFCSNDSAEFVGNCRKNLQVSSNS
jgi:hypothetical protein